MTTTRYVGLSVAMVVVVAVAFMYTTTGTVIAQEWLEHDAEPVVMQPEEVAGRIGYLAADALGSVDPGAIDVFGVEHTISEISLTGDELTVQLAPCVDVWEIAAITLGPPSDGTGRQGDLVIGDDPAEASQLTLGAASCTNDGSRWVVDGIPSDSLEVGHGTISVRFHVRSLTTSRSTVVEDSGTGGLWAERKGLRGMICALPDALIGEGACAPLTIFPSAIAVVVGMLVVGIRNPIALSGAGIIAMAGMSAIVMPAPVMVAGFIIAALGVTALLLLVKR